MTASPPGNRAAIAMAILAPLVISSAVIVQRSLDMGVGVADLPRPILVVCVFASLLTALLRVVLGDWRWAGLFSSATSLLLLRAAVPLAVVFGLLAWWLLLGAIRRVRGASRLGAPTLPTRINAVFAAALLLVGLVGLVSRGLREEDPIPVQLVDDGHVGGPSIYLFMLDGYPRADTLETTFGINNSGFAADLAAMGFITYPQSRSNYTKTWLSLASVFNVDYLDAFVHDLPNAQVEHMGAMHGYITNSSVMALLERRGYDTWSISSAFTDVAPEHVDHYIRPGHPTEFEVVLLQQSLLSRLVPDAVASFVASQEAAAVYDNLAEVARIADADSPSPKFVFAHVLSPHAPFILGADDPTSRMSECFPLSCPFWDPTTDGTGLSVAEYGAGLSPQIRALNSAILESIRDVIEGDPDGVVIVMSDHGTRYLLADQAEQFRNVLAIRSPGHAPAIGEEGALVNLFRGLTTDYFGTGLQPLPYEAWLSDWSNPMSVTLVDGVR